MFSDQNLRRRRRRRFLVPIALTLVFLLIWMFGSLRSDSLDATRFYDEVRSVAITQATGAENFQLMLVSLAADRAQFVAQMDQLEEAVATGLSRVAMADIPEEDIPDRVRGTQRIASRTLESWAAGLERFEEASLAMVDNPEDLTAQTRLGEALSLLGAGDALYTVLAQEVQALGVELELNGSMPIVAFLPVNGATPGFLDALSARLVTATDLVTVKGIAIANVKTIPEPTGGEQGESVRLPFTDSVDIQVVVANDGNVPESNITVGVRLEDINGAVIRDENEVIELLEAGEEYVANFAGWPVEDDVLYNLRVFVLPSSGGAIAPEPVDFGFFVASAIDTTTTSSG